MNVDFEGARDALERAVGAAHVITAAGELQAAETATFATQQQIHAIVRPANREEVQECLRIANRFGTPVWPISGGKNTGYGSRVPFASKSIVLDLGRMNRIVELDEEMAYVTVEPGVTFAQLFAHLAAQGSNLFINTTGTDPGASLVGNAMERGIGKGPYGDRFSAVSNLEIVLPTGDVVETGFARFPNAKAAAASRWALGPYLDGIFSQSNFGVVTRMTVWLTPKPKYFQTFYYQISDAAKLGPLVDAVRRMRLNHVIRTPVLLGNDYRWVSFQKQYPFAESNGATPLSSDLLARMRKEARRGVWNGDGALYSHTKRQAAAEREVVQQMLEGVVDKLEFWDERKARAANVIAGIGAKVSGKDIRPFLDIAYRKSVYIGVPIAPTFGTVYWRKRNPPPMPANPERDRVGVLWYSPALPANGESACAAVEIAQKLSLAYGFEPNIGLNFISERQIDLTGSLLYDREVAGEDERAMACHDELLAKLAEAGFYPYRLGVQSMNKVGGASPAYTELVGRLKRTLDPRGILAPGKYGIDTGEDAPQREST